MIKVIYRRKVRAFYEKGKIRLSKLGKPRSDETKRKLSESHKGKIPWNKGLKGIKK